MKVKTEISLYVLLGFFFYLIDINTKTYDKSCIDTGIKKMKFNLNILFHHIISTSFFHFAWLSTNPYILFFYVFFAIIVVIHWKIFGDCIFNIHARKQCNGNYNFPMGEMHTNPIIKIFFLEKIFNAFYFLTPIVILKLIIYYKYKDRNILAIMNIFILSIMLIINKFYLNTNDTGL